MQRIKRVAILLTDTIQTIGLQTLLTEYFPPVEVSCFSTMKDFESMGSDSYDFYFTEPDIFILNTDYFLPRRNKSAILIKDNKHAINNTNSYFLQINETFEVLIEQLEQLFSCENGNTSISEGNKELSAREIDVLQLIVKGCTNKEVAEKLNISLNTVLSHRKNITSKLGIKTVSGLTFYSIMNGLVAGEDIEI